MITEERIQALERDIQELKFWHFSQSRKMPQVTAMGVKAEIEYAVYPVTAGQQVFMNGGLSRGTIQRYNWEQTGGPQISHSNLDPVCMFIAPEVEIPTALTFALTVTDSSNQTSRADVLVHITPKHPSQEFLEQYSVKSVRSTTWTDGKKPEDDSGRRKRKSSS